MALESPASCGYGSIPDAGSGSKGFRSSFVRGRNSLSSSKYKRPKTGSASRPVIVPTNTRVMATAFLAALTTGAPTYAFGLYGSTLKRAFRLTQSQLETIAAASFAAGLVSWLPGLAVDRWGPCRGLEAGGAALSILLGCNWLVSRRIVELPHDWIVFALGALAFGTFAANSLVIGGVFKSLVVTCRHGKGAAVGAAKAYVGLGAGVYACLFDSLRQYPSSSDLDFLLLASVASLLFIAIPGAAGVPGPAQLRTMVDASTPRHFQVVYAGLTTLVAAVLGSSFRVMFRPSAVYLDDGEPDDLRPSSSSSVIGRPPEDDEPRGWRAAALLVCCFAPLAALLAMDPPPPAHTAAGACDHRSSGESSDLEKGNDSIDAVEHDDESDLGSDEEEEELLQVYDPPCISERPRSYSLVVDDLSLTQMLARPSAWLFLGVSTLVVGSGTLIATNAGQMVESLGFPPRVAGASLSLFSVAQAVARALTGCLSEHLWRRCHTPRTAFAVLSAMLGAAGHGVLAFASDRPSFATGVILVGLSFGMIWPLMVLIVGDLYGKRYHGANYMLYDGFTSAVGTILIAKFLAPSLYEREIRAEGELTCYGRSCFAATHTVVALLCALACALAVAMLVLTQQCYRPTPEQLNAPK